MRKDSKRWFATASLFAAVTLAGVLGAGSAEAANLAMKDLMKKMGATASNDDAKALAPMMVQAKTLKPNDPDYAGWDAIADDGKAAAEKGDMAAAKATCKSCHSQYREKFKAKYGSKAP